jgi:hypothetical protein
MMIHRLKSTLWIFDIGLRRMNGKGAPGWAAQMAVFSALALTLMGAVELGVPTAWPFTIIGSLDLLATQHFARTSFRRIRRLRCLAPARARWWIELAALDWTLCMSTGVFALTHGQAAAAPPAWQQDVVAVAGYCAAGLFVPFLALTVLGFAVGLIQRQRIRGRSLELVTWFFWSIVVIVGACRLVPEAPVLVDWVAPGLAVLSAVALSAAGVVAVGQRLLRLWAQRSTKPSGT